MDGWCLWSAGVYCMVGVLCAPICYGQRRRTFIDGECAIFMMESVCGVAGVCGHIYTSWLCD